MRSPDEIRTDVLRLHYTKKLMWSEMARAAGISTEQLKSCITFDASETTLMRLDAYLDAPHLHVVKIRNIELLRTIELLKEELWWQFRRPSGHMETFETYTAEKLNRVRCAIEGQLKRLLRRYYELESGKQILFLEADSYWKCKAKVLVRQGKLDEKYVRDSGLWNSYKAKTARFKHPPFEILPDEGRVAKPRSDGRTAGFVPGRFVRREVEKRK